MKLLPIYIISFVIFYIVLKIFVKRKDLMKFFLLSPIMGLAWEIMTADIWTYDMNQFTIFYFWNQEIPLDGIFTWGVLFTLALILTELIQKKLFKKSDKVIFLISSILAMTLIGYLVEYTGIYFGMWSYTYAKNYPVWISIVPLNVWVGWMFFGTVMLTTIKFYSTKGKIKI